MHQYHIGLDIGSTACKGVLLSEDWVPVRESRATHPTIYPRQGWAEQEPQAWWRNTTRVLRKLVEDIPRDSVRSIGLSGQMEGPVIVDKGGKPLENCVIWLDTRASAVVREYEKRIDLGWLYKTTGLRLNPMHTAMKLIWLQKNRRKISDKAWKFLLPKDYVRYLLTGQMGTDISDASSTLLLDIKINR